LTIFKMLTLKNVSEIFWLSAGQLITMVLGVVSIKLLTSMGPEEYGKYSLVLTISALLSLVLYGPLEQGFLRFYFDYANKGMAKTYLKLFYKYLFFAGFLCLLLAVLTIPAFVIMRKTYQTSFVFIVSLFVILLASSNSLSPMLNLLRKRKTNAIIQIFEKCLAIVFLYVVFSFTKLTALSAFMVLFLSILIVVAVKIVVLNTFVPNDDETNIHKLAASRKDIINVVKKFSMPFGIWGITGWLQLNSERWVIAHYLTTADVGIFAVMISIANYIVAIPCGILGQFVTPIIYNKYLSPDETSQRVSWHQIFTYYIIVTIAIVTIALIVAIFFGYQIIMFVSDSKFVEYWHILPILCLGTGLFQVGQSLTVLGMLVNTPDKYLVPKICSGIFAVVANVFLIYYFGIVGAAISITFIGIIYLLLVLYVNNKINIALSFKTN